MRNFFNYIFCCCSSTSLWNRMLQWHLECFESKLYWWQVYLPSRRLCCEANGLRFCAIEHIKSKIWIKLIKNDSQCFGCWRFSPILYSRAKTNEIEQSCNKWSAWNVIHRKSFMGTKKKIEKERESERATGGGGELQRNPFYLHPAGFAFAVHCINCNANESHSIYFHEPELKSNKFLFICHFATLFSGNCFRFMVIWLNLRFSMVRIWFWTKFQTNKNA